MSEKIIRRIREEVVEKIIRRIREEVAELDEYVIENEKVVYIDKIFTDRIKAMEKEISKLKKVMFAIGMIRKRCPSFINNEEDIINNLSKVS